MAVLTLSPDRSSVMFLQSRYLTVILKEDEWDLSSLTTSCQPSVSVPSCYPSSLLPIFFPPPSFLSLTQCEQYYLSGGCWWWRRLGNSCLPPTFLTLYPLQWLSVLSVRAPAAPPNPAVPPFCGLEGCTDRRIQRSPEMEGNGGRWWQEEEAFQHLNRKEKQQGSGREAL